MTEWKSIPDFPQYEASTDGQIRNKETLKVIAPYKHKGYDRVRLRKDGVKFHRKVHRLVAITHSPPIDGCSHVLHGSKGQQDNSVENLRWGTHSQNMLDRRRDGTDPRGENHPCAKLKTEDIPLIRWMGSFSSCRTIADTFGVSYFIVRGVLKGLTWTHI